MERIKRSTVGHCLILQPDVPCLLGLSQVILATSALLRLDLARLPIELRKSVVRNAICRRLFIVRWQHLIIECRRAGFLPSLNVNYDECQCHGKDDDGDSYDDEDPEWQSLFDITRWRAVDR